MNAELATGHLDLAICVRPEKPCPEAQWDILAEIHWTLALPRTHALASKKEILLADIAQLNVLALCPREYPEYWVFVQNWLQRHKVFVGLRAEFDGVVSLLTAVRTGMGVALVAATTAQNFPLWAEYRLLEVEPDPVPLSLAYHRDLAQSQPAQALRQALQDAGRKHLPREGDF
jgi:DNA-binding transcriptional LysR family regulator